LILIVKISLSAVFVMKLSDHLMAIVALTDRNVAEFVACS